MLSARELFSWAQIDLAASLIVLPSQPSIQYNILEEANKLGSIVRHRVMFH